MNKEELKNFVETELTQYKYDPYETDEDRESFLSRQEKDLINFASSGNFSLLIGPPKSRKSTLMILFAASVLTNVEKKSFIQSPTNCEEILWIDTEQSRSDFNKATKKIFHLSGKGRDKVHCYNLRSIPSKKRFEYVDKLIQHHYYNNVRFVFIDGIADLLTKGYNDENEAKNISDYLIETTEKYNIHIMTAMHVNKKAEDVAKGHLGAFLIQKAETVLVVQNKKNSPFSEVTPKYLRDKEISSFYISYNDKGYPCFLSRESTNIKNTSREPKDSSSKFHRLALDTIFPSGDVSFLRHQFIVKIRDYLDKQEIHISMNKATHWIKYYKDQGLVIQLEKKDKPYCLPQE